MPYIPKYTPEEAASRRQHLDYTYYRAEYADAIKPIIDAMLSDRRDRSFSCAKYGKTVATLERLINRAINYLIDNNDTPDRRYYKFRRSVFVKKIYKGDENKNSVDILWKVPYFGGALNLGSEDEEKLSVPAANDTRSDTVAVRNRIHVSVDWQEAIDNYINAGEVGTELEINDLNLDSEAVLAVKASVSGVSEIMLVSVDCQKIVIRKVK